MVNTCIENYNESHAGNFGYNRLFIGRNSDFIEHNSHITGHDSINVFGQTDINYFVKSSDQAIDIVLKT